MLLSRRMLFHLYGTNTLLLDPSKPWRHVESWLVLSSTSQLAALHPLNAPELEG